MQVEDVQESQTYRRVDTGDPHQRVKVTRIWTADDSPTAAYDIFGTDGRGRPSTSHSAMPISRFAELYEPY